MRGALIVKRRRRRRKRMFQIDPWLNGASKTKAAPGKPDAALWQHV